MSHQNKDSFYEAFIENITYCYICNDIIRDGSSLCYNCSKVVNRDLEEWELYKINNKNYD